MIEKTNDLYQNTSSLYGIYRIWRNGKLIYDGMESESKIYIVSPEKSNKKEI